MEGLPRALESWSESKDASSKAQRGLQRRCCFCVTRTTVSLKMTTVSWPSFAGIWGLGAKEDEL